MRSSRRGSAKGRRGFYTISEAAKLLTVSPSTVWRWIDQGKLSAYRVGEKTIRIETQEIAAVVTRFRRVRRKGGAMTKEVEGRALVMPMSPVHGEDQSTVIEEARQLQERIVARRKGHLLPDSYLDITAAREERTARS